MTTCITNVHTAVCPYGIPAPPSHTCPKFGPAVFPQFFPHEQFSCIHALVSSRSNAVLIAVLSGQWHLNTFLAVQILPPKIAHNFCPRECVVVIALFKIVISTLFEHEAAIK